MRERAIDVAVAAQLLDNWRRDHGRSLSPAAYSDLLTVQRFLAHAPDCPKLIGGACDCGGKLP